LKKQFIYIFILSIFCNITSLFGNVDSISLKSKVDQNSALFIVNIDSAFAKIDDLLDESIAQHDTASELKLLDRKCRYYYQTNQLDLLISASEELHAKAKQYKNLHTQAMSLVYISEAYSANQVNDKSIEYLNHAMELLKEDNSGDRKIILTKSNVLNSFANTYVSMGQPEKAVEKLHAVINNYKDLNDLNDILQFQYINYSNIANIFTIYNLDSAEYYALKSIEIKPHNIKDDKIMLTNSAILGKVYKEKEEFQKALKYFQKAIFISQKTGEQLNLIDIYSNLVEVYNLLDMKDSAIYYDNKLKELEISSLQKKYSSLQLIINKDLNEETNNRNNWVIGLILFLLTSFAIIFFYLKKKQKGKRKNPVETYHTLIEMVKANDPGFMFAFDQNFPQFSSQLLKINNKLTNSEIEFCALLKLNLSTKEIAKYRFIEHRTVQNKKHRIRKRLNIPSSADIYNWFNNIQ